jgi:rod shape-determining protein MreB
MGFFKYFKFFSNDLAIDLGTANTVIWKNGEIVLNEPSVVAYDNTRDKIIAIGGDAKQMLGKTPKDIDVMKPMKDGVIADPRVAEGMLRAYISRVSGNLTRKIIVCVPSGVTEAEKRIVRDSCEHAGAKEVYLISEPMAGAIGIGLDVLNPVGSMIIDIGGGTTEIAVIALGGIVCDISLKIAGNVLTESILQYFRDKHNLLIGEIMADEIKCSVGSAFPIKNEENISVDVRGKDLVSGIPSMISVTPAEIRENALAAPIESIVKAIFKLLEDTPPELARDIYKYGIWLSGGGALLKGLDKRIEKATNLKVSIPEEPLLSVVIGTGKVLENLNEYSSVLLKHSTYL